jgi:EAL domain-containing protein (putative c-di-GMP-specific phosphodiesterase class I)/GGDEF domain-containing protein
MTPDPRERPDQAVSDVPPAGDVPLGDDHLVDTGAGTAIRPVQPPPPPPGLFAAPVAETQVGYARRDEFSQQLEQALMQLRRITDSLTVVLVELEGYETPAGVSKEMCTELVAAIGMRLHKSRRAGESVALLREHEFAILAVKAGKDHARSLLDRVRELVQTPFGTAQGGAIVRANFGVAVAHDPNETVVSLLRRADDARLSGTIFDDGEDHSHTEAPRSHTETPHGAEVGTDATIVRLPNQGSTDDAPGVVEPRPSDRPQAKNPPPGTDLIVDVVFSGRFCLVDLVPDLGALERGEMALVYRPVYDLLTGAVVALQALARWNPSNGGVGRAIEVAASADMNGGARSIGKWIVKTAFAQTEELQQLTGRLDLSVRVPLAARQLETDDLLDHVARALIESRLAPEQVVLEVPESTAMGGNSTARAVIDGLKALGVKTSIADFGSGYTSFDYLQFLEVDEITVRCPFLADSSGAQGEYTVLEPLVNLTHAIGLRIVVDGVDTFSQLTQTRDAGIRFAQGELLGPALDAAHIGKQMLLAPEFSRAVRTAASL